MKFKVGDRVKYVGPYLHNQTGVKSPLEDVQEGHLGEVVEVISREGIPFPYDVQFDGLIVSWPMDEVDLELVQ